jgi:hypothetical protein
MFRGVVTSSVSLSAASFISCAELSTVVSVVPRRRDSCIKRWTFDNTRQYLQRLSVTGAPAAKDSAPPPVDIELEIISTTRDLALD